MKLPELALSQWPHSSTTPPPWQQLSQLLEQLNHEQRLWLSGYLAASSQHNTTPVSQPSPAPQKHLTVLYGSQTGNGTRVAKQLQVGIVWVNCWLLRDLRTPFGGMKASGSGREGGLEALRFFTEPKNVCVQFGP